MLDIEIQTDRLVIKDLEISNAADMYKYRSHDLIIKYQSFYPKNVEEVIAFIKENTKHFNLEDNWHQVGIFNKAELIGDIGIHFVGPQNMQCEIGYTIDVKYQRKGYGKEAVCGVLDYLLLKLKKHRVIASLDPENSASIRLLESIGFRKEGLMQKSVFVNNRWEDDLVYALLNDEWIKINKCV